MFIGYTIGYIRNRNTTGMINYSLQKCNLVYNHILNDQIDFCYLFNVNEMSGRVSLNRSTFTKFQNNYFMLNVSAQSRTSKFKPVVVNPIVADYQKKAKFVFSKSRTVCARKSGLFDNLKSEINDALRLRYNDGYFLDFFNFEIFNVSQSLEFEFYISLNFSWSIFKLKFQQIIYLRVDACFYVGSTSNTSVLTFREAKHAITSLDGYKVIKKAYSILDIEVRKQIETWV